ncbi:hypothetical protein [Paenibacillus ferrarius]
MKKRTKKWLAAAGIVVALLVSADVGGAFTFIIWRLNGRRKFSC